MRYIKWAALALFMPIRKILGLFWVFACIPFRAYVRNYVYNYFLQNDCAPKRLQERSPERIGDVWLLKDIHGVGFPGIVEYRPVHKAWAWILILFIWGFLDDDSNHDTFDAGHIHKHYIAKDDWKIGSYQKQIFIDLLQSDLRFGNTFDLGDKRSWWPHYNFWAVLIWNSRNSAYNFSYLWEQSNNPTDSWYFTLGPLEFGWKPDGQGWHTLALGLK